MKFSFKDMDYKISLFMNQFGVLAIRISFGIIFIWFGILKPLGISSAEPLVIATVQWLPVFGPKTWVAIIGYWEVLIGIFFIFRMTTRIAIGLLALQMVGTFLPLLVLPEVTFQAGYVPFVPTMEGQYIIKNLMIISAALVVGGTVHRKEKHSQ